MHTTRYLALFPTAGIASQVEPDLPCAKDPLLQPTSAVGTNGIALASHDDLATMKLSAVANRGSRKDFFDLWILLQRHRSLSEYLDLYRQKFAQRDIGHVIRSLVYFEEADHEPPLRLLTSADWNEVKLDLRRRVEELLG